MTEGAIIQLPQWLKTPAGEYLLAWEQRHLDQAVADVFGFHALQLGLPELDALGANRMPHRWLAVESPPLTAEARAEAAAAEPEGAEPGQGGGRAALPLRRPAVRIGTASTSSSCRIRSNSPAIRT